MGRPARSRALDLWMNGEPVGRWTSNPRTDDALSYDARWLASAQFRPISLSLPPPAGGGELRSPAVAAYFDNLLPDSDAIRRRIQQRFRTPSLRAFDLLAALGRDCVGALQIVPDGEVPPDFRRIEAEPLDEAGVAAELRRTVLAPVAGAVEDGPLRISLAGAQEKTALTWHKGKWCRPIGATPSTHIFKLPLGLVGGRQADMRLSVENEWLCAQILRRMGVPVAGCDIQQFEDQKVLVVERFDRRLVAGDAGYWLRLPQEDFCQATGNPPSLKYQADGGPGMREISQILQQSSARDADMRTFITAQLLFWMLAAPDGHAKNFSLFLETGNQFRMTPLYDVLSFWPLVGNGANLYPYRDLKLAMGVRGRNVHYEMHTIQARHFIETAQRLGLGIDMGDLMREAIDRVPAVIDELGRILPKGFPEQVFETVTKGLQESASKLARQLA